MDTRNVVARALGAALSAALFLGCNAILGNESEYRLAVADAGAKTCTLNSDCAKGKVCIFKTCSARCHADVDCDPGFRCLDTDPTSDPACVTSAQARCTSSECPTGTICSAGTCRTSCDESRGCRNDQTCIGGACLGTDPSHDPKVAFDGGAGGSTGTGGSGGTDGGSHGGDASVGSGGRQSFDAGTDASGGAVSDPCVGVTCNGPPTPECTDAATRRAYDAIGSCSAGTCSYAHNDTTCAFGCASGECKPDPCASVQCGTPPANTCKDTGHLTAYDTQGSCSGGTCSYTSQTIACTCVSDACTTDPCATVTCNKPPVAACTDASTRRTFDALGTCSGGSCTYGHTDTICSFGCSNGACNADPCASITCNSPPVAACVTSTSLRTYLSPGTCSAGICSYSSKDTSCQFGCSNGACNADPCASVTCTSAPTASCQSTSTLRKYASTGTCSGGTCTYAYTDSTCTNQTCIGSGCTGTCAQGQKTCVSNGFETCTSTGVWSAPTACVNQACVNGACQGVCAPNPTPTQCLDTNTPQYCDAAGQYAPATDCSGTKPVCLNGGCVQCTAASQCSASNECYTATCTSNTCGQQAKSEGSPCTAGVGYVCNGAGSCSECTPNYAGNCSTTEVCRSYACVNAIETVGWQTATSGSTSPPADWLYMMKLPAIVHDATVLRFGVVGTITGAIYKLAIYADDGSGTQPGTGAPLVVTPSGIAVGNGALETASITPTGVTLAKGTTYWLAFKANAQVAIHAAANASQVGWRGSNAFNDAFPSDPMSTVTNLLSQNGTSYAVYVVVQDLN